MQAFLDMPSGISGDILLGCLIDAGWSVDALAGVIQSLNVPQDRWRVRTETVMRGALAATLVHVDVSEEAVHRRLSDIVEIIGSARLPAGVAGQAIAVFTALAEAEAEVHGMDPETVHFHEVGAMDAIIDIVGVCAGLVELDVSQLYAGSFPLGEGWTRAAHGAIPLPAPATLALLAAASAPTRPAPGPGELVTPTGAALVCTLARFSQPRLVLKRIGTGAGQKEFAWPNIARLWLGSEDGSQATRSLPPEYRDRNPAVLPLGGTDQGFLPGFTRSVSNQLSELIQLETNIDDMNPELYAPVQQLLFDAGALDVWLTPIQMKKGRPATLLGVLAQPEAEDVLMGILLRETTTLGVRVHDVRRHEAERESCIIQTPYGSIRAKLKRIDGMSAGVKPEFEDCRRAADQHSVPLRLVYDAINRALAGESK